VANPSYTLITATGTTNIWLDNFQSPFNMAYAVEFAAGTTGSFTVNFTLDDPNPLPGSINAGWTPIWIADPTNGTAKTATAAGSYVTPIRGLQVIFSAISGSAMLAVVQGMSSR
jgi:hypothetical protein